MLVVWNLEVIQSTFNNVEQAMILSIPLSHCSTNDKMFWWPTKDGVYRVKSGYWFAKQNGFDASSNTEDLTWKIVWNLKAPPKLCHFLWRACKGFLAVRQRLYHRYIISDMRCTICETENVSKEELLTVCLPGLHGIARMNLHSRTMRLIRWVLLWGSLDLFMTIMGMLQRCLRTLTVNVSRERRKLFMERASTFFIEVDDVSITSLNFGKVFMESIEAKQIAQQEAERSKFVVEKAEQEKKSAIIRAQGEAKSAQLIDNHVYLSSDYLLIDLKSLDTDSEEAAFVSGSEGDNEAVSKGDEGETASRSSSGESSSGLLLPLEDSEAK
uniref:Prohibitin n=1 Tax=Chenopodium quinoa TaxID=63459 RepID=A0A803MVM2_CHEQI